jgi:LysR family glycine cleavage system transcriptional activator
MFKRNLPSLLSIRHFESAGRHLSFKLAAAELNVTQAAVSHQIRYLEEELGVQLFNRLHQRIELTNEGVTLLNVAMECLDRLAESFDQISGRNRSERIRVTITPLLSARWLVPQIDEFLDRHDGAEIILHHSLQPPNDRGPKHDIKIFYSTEPLSVPEYEFLFTDRIVPMCSPMLLEKIGSTDPSVVLAKARIVHEFNYDWWAEWCRRRGVDVTLVQTGLVLDDPAVLENAALQERNIILGSTTFLRERLNKSELILPFGTEPSLGIWYYAVMDSGHATKRAVLAFRQWLLQRAALGRGSNA